MSALTVTPTLAGTSGETLSYLIEIRNTGAYMAEGITLSNTLPSEGSYNGDAQASSGPAPTVVSDTLSWAGDVGFDASVWISYSVTLSPGLPGTVRNTAVINQALIPQAVTVTAETVVTDSPILTITKQSAPAIPGAEKLLVYTLAVENRGQLAANLPITVTDYLPANTTFDSAGSGAFDGAKVTWTRTVTLSLGETSLFTFSVNVDNVLSGTVITNSMYQVASASIGIAAGDVHTTTVLDPILFLSKQVYPDPPGSNREMTYTLILLNKGAMATGLVITDSVPAGTAYVRGGTLLPGDVVSWSLPVLNMDEAAYFTYTVYISDVKDVEIVNAAYSACAAEGVCVPGGVITSLVHGPTFEVYAALDPIAKKPGGGGGPVTPTLMVRNIGPGNAIDASARLIFRRISVGNNDLIVIPPVGTPPPLPDGPDCGSHCVSYDWIGSLGVGDVVTFTTIEGQSTIGGSEGTVYSATIIVSDTLANVNTEPVTATAYGHVTHKANLIPTKSAPDVIGRGQLLTYTINVWNSALSTDEPPTPWLTDTLPLSVTLVSVSDGGVSQTVGERTVVSWALPSMSPGDTVRRSFTVRVADNLISGTQIINDDYRASWYEAEDGAVFSNTGQPVTTTVIEVGLVDSFKTVEPSLALPGPDNELTYYVHIVNSSGLPLQDVVMYDILPWEHSTYQRDAVASAGAIISDIVSISWVGDVGPHASETITFTVLVDPYYKGALTNTATITHPSLLNEVVVKAVAYITDEPVLKISKKALPDPVAPGGELLYTIRVVNLGQQATNLVIEDVIPAGTEYVAGSASAGGQFDGSALQWAIPVLTPGQMQTFSFRVTVGGGSEVVNADYSVVSAEGASAYGKPVVTAVSGHLGKIFLPHISR